MHLARILLSGNPFRVPAGSPEGGQFASAPGGGYAPELRKALDEHESTIRGNPIEHAILFRRDGKRVHATTSNKPDEVRFIPEFVKEEFGDGVLTHNHPRNFSLSVADGHLAAASNLSEIRAVTDDGVYSLRRTGKEWPSNFRSLLDLTQADVSYAIRTKIRKGEMTIEQANNNHYGELWTRLVREVNDTSTPKVLYRFEPKGDK